MAEQKLVLLKPPERSSSSVRLLDRVCDFKFFKSDNFNTNIIIPYYSRQQLVLPLGVCSILRQEEADDHHQVNFLSNFPPALLQRLEVAELTLNICLTVKIPPLKSRGNRPLPLNDTCISLSKPSPLDLFTSAQQPASSDLQHQSMQLTLPSLYSHASEPPVLSYPTLSGAHIRRGSRSSNHSSAASSFVSSISQVEARNTRSNISDNNSSALFTQPTTGQKLFSTSTAFESRSLLPPTLNHVSSVPPTKEPPPAPRVDIGLQGLKSFPSAVDNFANTFDGLGIGVGLCSNGIGPRDWGKQIPEMGVSRIVLKDAESKVKESSSVDTAGDVGTENFPIYRQHNSTATSNSFPSNPSAKIIPPSLNRSFLHSSFSQFSPPSSDSATGPISQPMERSTRISIDSLFSSVGTSSKFSDSADGTSKNTTPDFEVKPLSNSFVPSVAQPQRDSANTSRAPLQTLSVSEAKRLLTPQELQKLITSSLNGLGILEERKLVVRGFESIEAEMESLRLRKAQLQGKWDLYPHIVHQRTDQTLLSQSGKNERETLNTQKLLRRHVSCLKAFNGVEGERFGESLVSAVRTSDSLNLELQEGE